MMDNEQEAKLVKRWNKFQERLGFTDEELSIYRSFPKNVKAMENARGFATHELVVEIIEARNCAAGYTAGDSFRVDASGMLIPEKCPPKLCAAAVWAFKPLIDRIWEAFYHGGTDCFHDTVRCPDVGVEKGGAGFITMRIRAVPTKFEGGTKR
jgi:uncharacterized repeat protein (TIGR04076 family)